MRWKADGARRRRLTPDDASGLLVVATLALLVGLGAALSSQPAGAAVQQPSPPASGVDTPIQSAPTTPTQP
ncbi:MAG TPA: hypothetical protein VM305_03180 [Candidatus Limnocylindrales bacterium]|nr:hypothetical protein [Candidatus Limnocylindrales bacterium]